jgi:deoxyadenosine/deoxycytidine kinase
LDYLKRLNERYEAWISTYNLGKLVILNIDELDFENDPNDANFVINKIEAELNGLF